MVSGPSLTPKLLGAAHLAEEVASAAGLTFFDVVFEMLDSGDVNALAAYGGFPTRYPSWRFGMEYERLARGHEWGLSKIYELVINHDPTIAYLVRSNSFMEQKLVMAHVFGHADFFRNNAWFAPTDRQMVQRFEGHARCIKEHSACLGQDRVDEFLDAALSLDGLIDPYQAQRRMREQQTAQARGHVETPTASGTGPASLASASRARLALLQGDPDETTEEPDSPLETALRDSPFDVLGFLTEHADVEPWQRDILRIVAYEAEYFAPQRMTKIINEGWASFWHSRLLTGGLLDASEIVEFADCHAGATAAAPGQLNPYKLGIDLFRHAEERGEDIFRLRSVHNDVSFIDAVVDEEFVGRSKLFAMEPSAAPGRGPVIGTRDAIEVKGRLLSQLAWGGLPRVRLEDEGHSGNLVLRHEHDGRDLKLDEAGVLLKTVGRLWKGPVELLTQEGDENRRLVCEKGDLSMREG